MKVLTISQAVVSILLIISILLQQRGGGLSSIFGGEGGYYLKKRGTEKIIFWGTVTLSLMFFGLAFLNFLF